MNVVQWDPFKELDLLFDGFRGRGETIRGGISGQGQDEVWSPATDIIETADAYECLIEAPGIDPRGINITIESGVLSICGNREALAIETGERIYRRERRAGKFSRRFRLPKNTDESSIAASGDHGLIKVVIKKKETPKARVIDIDVS